MARTLAEYKAALIASGGMQAPAAKRLGVGKSAVTMRIQRTPELQQVVNDEREAMLDEAEQGLRAAIKDREPWAICFTLKTIGKERGYVERQEHTGPGGHPVEFTLNLGDADHGDRDSD